MDKDLTTSQRKVIDFPYKPASTLRVVAGPGAGKTLTLLHKVHHLVKTEQVRPDEILVLSLTNKAIDSIVARLVDVFKEHSDNTRDADHELREIVGQIHVNTIHGLANRIVIENEGLVSVIEENGWRGLMKLLSQDPWNTLSSKPMTPREVQKIFAEYKSGRTKKNELMERLLKIMKDCRVLTNEDLISNASRYLDRGDEPENLEIPSFTRDLINGFKVVVIDEFQDLFPSLLPLLEGIAVNKQLILFGDPNQSIYNFLGNNKIVIDRLDKLHESKNLAVIHLHDNFRNTPEIMSIASKVMSQKVSIDKDAMKEVILRDHSGVHPEFHQIEDPIEELEFLLERISILICSGAFLSDVAILTRTNAQVHTIAEHLSLYGIPFQKLTSQPAWMSDIRVQFLIGLLRTVVLVRKATLAHSDSLASKRSNFSVVVTLSAIRGVSDPAVQSLFEVCNEKNMSLWHYITEYPKNEWPSAIRNKKKIERYIAMMLQLIEKDHVTDIEDPLELLTSINKAASTSDFAPMMIKNEPELLEYKSNLEEMFRVMKACALDRPPGCSLADWFLENYVERGIMQQHDDMRILSKGLGAVNISTIHSSKGLEFPIVFLTGSPTVFPADPNLLYVGITRARNLLYLNNIKHANVTSNGKFKNNSSLLLNNKFWTYYNEDLKRPNLYSATQSLKAYGAIRNKYGFNSINKRTITTWNYRNFFSLFKRLI